MHYPEEFKAKVKEVYPDWDQLHESLDKGSVIVGRMLDNSRSRNVPVSTILKAASLEELKKEAQSIKKKDELYRDWRKLYEEQHPNEEE